MVHGLAEARGGAGLTKIGAGPHFCAEFLHRARPPEIRQERNLAHGEELRAVRECNLGNTKRPGHGRARSSLIEASQFLHNFAEDAIKPHRSLGGDQANAVFSTANNRGVHITFIHIGDVADAV